MFLVLIVDPGGEGAVADLLPDVAALRRAIGFRAPAGDLSVVLGIGSDFWDRLFPGAPRPADLHRFIPLAGDRHTAPATPGDLLFHIRARRLDMCFELAQRLTERLDGAARVIDEVHGFRSWDQRDLLGFVDGTENPEGDAAVDAALIGAEDPDFAGGSYVIVQKYLHDLSGWNALSIEAQERIIGRTKLDDIELPDGVQPANSHVAVNQVSDADGVEQEIVRFNMPFGEVGTGDFGTYFIGYAADPGVTEQMLANMFIGTPPGNTDRVLDFSTAITGNLFYVPSADFLDDPPRPGDSPSDAADATSPAPTIPLVEPIATVTVADAEGSLGIGSLKGAHP